MAKQEPGGEGCVFHKHAGESQKWHLLDKSALSPYHKVGLLYCSHTY